MPRSTRPSAARLTVPFALLLVAVAGCGPRTALEDETPIDVSQPPVQTGVLDPNPLRLDAGGFEFTITPVAHYTLRGIVVSRQNYRLGWNAELAPCDVAMVWGELSADDSWRKLTWSQSGRWYFWRWSGERPFPDDVIIRNSSNTHLVPRSSDLRNAARALARGDIVELVGDLVTIEGRKGSERVWWRSSLSRDDTGDGSCELLYLRRMRVHGKVYE